MIQIVKAIESLNKDPLFWVLIVAVVFDILSGIIIALKYHRFISSIMGIGLQNKMTAILSAVALYVIFEIMGMNTVADLSFGFITVKELTSWLENLSTLGYGVPKWITTYLNNSVELSDEKATSIINKKKLP